MNTDLTIYMFTLTKRRKLLQGLTAKYWCSFGEETKEVIDSYWEVEKKVQTLAQMIGQAKYPIIFTGAGISTSIGIPDYRSGHNTVINTGPGLWNRDLHPPNQPLQPHQIPIDKLVDVAHPSLSHMFIATLLKKNILKYLVSQNTDGLHLRSGVPLDKISELHGNRNLEHCLSCKRKYKRDFRTLMRDGKVYKPGQKRDHFTGRYCENCGGELHDSIIYFGEKLPSDQLAKAYFHAQHADLCICVGSSLTVRPSSLVPLKTVSKESPGKLCIINIQETPLDELAQQKIGYFCDEVFELLSQNMGIEIEPLVARHHLQLELREEGGRLELVLQGKDKEGDNLTFMRGVRVSIDGFITDQQVKGHKCVIPLQSPNKHIQIQVFHFGDKQKLTFTLNPSTLSPLTPSMMHYSRIQNGAWQFTS